MTVWLEVGGKKVRVELGETPRVGMGDGPRACSVDGRAVSVDARLLEPGVMSLLVGGRQYRCVLDGDGVVIGGRRHDFAVEDPRSLQGRRGAGAGTEGAAAG